MANQVLSRPMFKQSQAAPSVSPTVGGIGGMTTPDQNAQALKNMFAPQIPVTRPAQSFPTPQVGYKRGGEVIDGVAHFAEGGESMAFDAMGNPTGYTAPAPTPVPERIAERLTREDNRPRVDMPEVDPMGNVTGGVMSVPVPADRGAPPAPVSGRVMSMVPANPSYPGPGDPNFSEPPANVPDFRPGRTTAAPPPPNPKDESIQTNLQAIKARREASDQQREENKNLALLSAGLGMLSGTSRNAFANIGAGGQQGIATFAGLEKARREDDASRRQEEYQQQTLALQNKQLAQQREIAFAQIEKDPDNIRLYRALGGGDLMKGYQLVSSDATLKAAQTLAADITAPETERATARAFLNSRINEAMGSRSGAGPFSGFRDVTAR